MELLNKPFVFIDTTGWSVSIYFNNFVNFKILLKLLIFIKFKNILIIILK